MREPHLHPPGRATPTIGHKRSPTPWRPWAHLRQRGAGTTCCAPPASGPAQAHRNAGKSPPVGRRAQETRLSNHSARGRPATHASRAPPPSTRRAREGAIPPAGATAAAPPGDADEPRPKNTHTHTHTYTNIPRPKLTSAPPRTGAGTLPDRRCSAPTGFPEGTCLNTTYMWAYTNKAQATTHGGRRLPSGRRFRTRFMMRGNVRAECRLSTRSTKRSRGLWHTAGLGMRTPDGRLAVQGMWAESRTMCPTHSALRISLHDALPTMIEEERQKEEEDEEEDEQRQQESLLLCVRFTWNVARVMRAGQRQPMNSNGPRGWRGSREKASPCGSQSVARGHSGQNGNRQPRRRPQSAQHPPKCWPPPHPCMARRAITSMRRCRMPPRRTAGTEPANVPASPPPPAANNAGTPERGYFDARDALRGT